MEIILINPGGTPARGDTYLSSKKDRYMYPYSIIYLYNYLAKKGIQSKVFDMYLQKEEEILNYSKNKTKLLVGVTAQTYTSMIALNFIKKLKKQNPNAIVVVGGKHFWFTDKDVLNKYNEIDYVVRGEGEITFYDLVQAIQNKNNVDPIPGITYRKDGKIVRNPDRPQVRLLKQISLDYDILPFQDYFSKGFYMNNFEREKIKSLPLFLGRGCSQKCAFCIYNKFQYRTKKLDDVINDIQYLKKKFNTPYFTFSDPSFCERRSFAIKFCENLLSENINIKWSCEARVDTPLELLQLMAKAGCISVDFALESGSKKVLDVIRKKIDIAQVFTFAQLCHKLNIRSHFFVMVSLPEETEEDALQTINITRKLAKYCNSISVAATQIYPGTELENIAYSKKILPQDFSYHDPNYFHKYTDICHENVPLYFENLSIDFIRWFYRETEKIKNVEFDNMRKLLTKGLWGIRKMPSQSLSKNMRDVVKFSRAIGGKVHKAIHFSNRV